MGLDQLLLAPRSGNASIPDMSDFLWFYGFTSSGTLTDDAGGTYNLTNNNGVSFNSGEQAAEFTAASGQFFSLADAVALRHGLSNFTIAVRVKLKDTNHDGGIYSKWGVTSPVKDILLTAFGVSLADKFRFNASNGAGIVDSDFAASTWHVVILKRGSDQSQSIQVDGGSVISTTNAGSVTGTESVRIGREGVGTQYLNGYIDWIGRWNYKTSDEKDAALFNNQAEQAIGI